MIKKKRVMLLGIVSILIIALSVFLSGCSIFNDETYFGIPTAIMNCQMEM